MQVIERERGHYEVLEVPYGKVYHWCPERIVLACDCGKTLTWMGSTARCVCGASYSDVAEESGERPDGGGVYHPWLEEYEEWRKQKKANELRHEYYGFVGIENGG